MPLPRISYPDALDRAAAQLIAELGYSLEQPTRLARATVQLSDWYLAHPAGRSPLNETWAQAAYLAYYFPLNYARLAAIAQEGARLGFFEGLDRFVDFGSGLGSAAFALLKSAAFPSGGLAYDVSAPSLALQAKLEPEEDRGRLERSTDPGSCAKRAGPGTLACFSYSLTEAVELPAWAESCEALMIAEPSTQDDGRKLQSLRPRLLDRGFRLWAPCTHEGPCPLLERSARDWCHGRAFFAPPRWWARFESGLPMKNRTVTYSYLLARRSAPPEKLAGKARAVGDPMAEKGRTRVSVCRGPEREFLSWLPKRMKGDAPDLQRGDLLEISPDAKRLGNQASSVETRIESPDQVRWIE